jgi:hypothetical protein
MSPLSLLEPSIGYIDNITGERTPLESRALEMVNFAAWLAGAAFLLLLGRAVGSAQKDMANYLLDKVTPEDIPVRIPQTLQDRRIRYEQTRY